MSAIQDFRSLRDQVCKAHARLKELETTVSFRCPHSHIGYGSPSHHFYLSIIKCFSTNKSVSKNLAMSTLQRSNYSA